MNKLSNDEAVAFERLVIWERAAASHDEKCSQGANCRNREWHIGNDYYRRAQKERVVELESHVAAARAADRSEQ